MEFFERRAKEAFEGGLKEGADILDDQGMKWKVPVLVLDPALFSTYIGLKYGMVKGALSVYV